MTAAGRRTIIQLQDVCKTYPGADEPALRDISFEVNEGEKVGIVGANGSGKTTLFRLILNLLRVDAGRIEVAGTTNLEAAKQKVGFVGEHQSGLENFTPQELFMLSGQMYGWRTAEIARRSTEMLAFAGLEEEADNLIGGFSKGMAQRLYLALALFHRPRILLLDEPLSGLDPDGQMQMRDLLLRITEVTLLLATHNLDEVEEVCKRVIFLQQGRIVADIHTEDFQKEVYVLDSTPPLLETLKRAEVTDFKILWQSNQALRVRFVCEPQKFQFILQECRRRNIPVSRIRSHSILEDLYQQYVRR